MRSLLIAQEFGYAAPMQTVRTARFSLLISLFVVLFSPLASAQHPSLIEPYEVLYGKPQLVQRPLTPDKMAPSAATLALVQARTETMLARLGVVTAALGASTGAPELQRWADSVKRGHTEAEQLRNRGRHYAAWRKATIDFMGAELVSGLLAAVARGAAQDASVSSGPPVPLTEARTLLDDFYVRLQRTRVSSVSVALALSDAYAQWVDATSIIDLIQNRPNDLFASLEPTGITVPPEKREAFLRVLAEPIVTPLIRTVIDDATLALQASQTDPPAAVHPDEAALRQVARAYSNAARANLVLARAQREGRRLPERSAEDQFMGRLTGELLSQSLTFEQRHREDVGMAGALQLLGVSHAAYALSLAELAEVRVQLDPAVASAPDSASAEVEMDRLRRLRIVELEQRARESAAQAQAAVGYMPALIGLTYARGQELSDGSADDREVTLDELIKAQTLAELVAGLGASPLRTATPEEDEALRAASGDAAAISACIGQLKVNLEGPALGFVRNRGFRLSDDDFYDLFMKAVLKTCTGARDLSSMPGSLFWKVFKNEVASWFRAVHIFERAVPSLTALCSVVPSPDDEVPLQERCEPLQEAMNELSEEERQILDWHYMKKLSYAEIGQRLGKRENTVSQRARRALDKLRSSLQRQGRRVMIWLPVQSGFWASLIFSTRPSLSVPCSSESRPVQGS